MSRLLPEGVADRAGWSTDIYAAIAVARDRADGRELLCGHRGDRAGVRVSRGPAGARPFGDRLEGDRQAKDERGHSQAGARRCAGAAVLERQELCRAARCGEDRASALRAVRGFHRTRTAREDVPRRAQSGPDRRSDAGQHRVRGSAGRRARLSVCGFRNHPPRGVHAAWRDVLRHRASARLSGIVRSTALSLRGLQCRTLCEPQRSVPERGDASDRRAARRSTATCSATKMGGPRGNPARPNSPCARSHAGWT